MAMSAFDISLNACANNQILNEKSTEIAPITTVLNEKMSKSNEHNGGTLSDSILSTQFEPYRKRRLSMSSKALVILELSKKVNSSLQLDW